MPLVTLATLNERIATAPSRDAAEVADFRANCELVFSAALQTAASGAFEPTVLETFPAMREQRELTRLPLKQFFATLTRGPLWVWAKAYHRWLSSIPEETRHRMLAVQVSE